MNTLLQQKIKENNSYSVEEIDNILRNFIAERTIKDNKKMEYYNIPIAFDIETSSFKKFNQLNEEEKVSVMYEWSFSINGFVIIGRTWNEFMVLYDKLVYFFSTDERRHLVIYVQNLAYEFQFIRKRFEWEKVFSLEERKPIKAITVDGIEFRCSYLLSGYNLETIGKNLINYKILKLKGDLDYRLVRHSNTPLTEQELGYCKNDVQVVVCYIQEQIEKCGDISRIPLTKTGFVRNYTRNACLYDNNHNIDSFKSYRGLMKNLTLTPEVYIQLKQAFQGGFTHANAYWVNEIVHNVKSYDFTSSYPYVLVSEKFPMSRFERVKVQSVEQFEDLLKCYCCLFDCEFTNLKSKVDYENYLSVSHCRGLVDQIENNGRIVSANKLITTITEQDYVIIKSLYDWDNLRISNMYISRKQYLPTNFVKSILDKYIDKTELKDVKGKEVEYMNAKETVNSEYGMCVTDICRDEIVYDKDEWKKEVGNIEELISKYNKSVKRFLFYAWGVWVTAYARKNLFTGIYEFKDDYIYSDTDSIKVINYENHLDYIENYNKLVIRKLQLAMDYHKLDFNMTCPKTMENKTKQLGIWDDEGIYKTFKTLGAKRYITEKWNKKDKKYEILITVSGVNKYVASPYLCEKYGDKVFENFTDELYIPPEHTGKLCHTYIDLERKGCVKDYLGNIGYYDELSSVHLEPTSYDMSISTKYANYLLGIKENRK